MEGKYKTQEAVFHFLQNFVWRICYRYTHIQEDPKEYLYKSFIYFFKSEEFLSLNEKIEPFTSLKPTLRSMVIDTCIEPLKNNNITKLVSKNRLPNTKLPIHFINAKELIDTLRRLPSPLRQIFNMAVIDNFSAEYIFIKTKIPLERIKNYIMQARVELMEMLEIQTFAQTP
jgi:DNA-directed RNA polymerase specialized sigma24 family protein